MVWKRGGDFFDYFLFFILIFVVSIRQIKSMSLSRFGPMQFYIIVFKDKDTWKSIKEGWASNTLHGKSLQIVHSRLTLQTCKCAIQSWKVKMIKLALCNWKLDLKKCQHIRKLHEDWWGRFKPTRYAMDLTCKLGKNNLLPFYSQFYVNGN